MAPDEYDFAHASIEADSVLPRDDALIRVFRTDTGGSQFFFEVDYKFAENGNDFWVVIANFGIPSPSFAGSRAKRAQRQFTSAEAKSARGRIDEYFSGSDRNGYFPYNMGKGHFLGIEFVEGWIVIGNNVGPRR
jgi:hypothetical protein